MLLPLPPPTDNDQIFPPVFEEEPTPSPAPNPTPTPDPPVTNGTETQFSNYIFWVWAQDTERSYGIDQNGPFNGWGNNSWHGPFQTDLMEKVGGKATIHSLVYPKGDVLVGLIQQWDGTPAPDYDAEVNGDKSWWPVWSHDGGRTWEAGESIDAVPTDATATLTFYEATVLLVYVSPGDEEPSVLRSVDFGQTWE